MLIMVYQVKHKLDPVGSTVRYEMMKLCTGSVEDIYAFIYCKKWRFGQVSPMPDRLTHRAKIELLSSLQSIRVELS